jgi:hypothetical protein
MSFFALPKNLRHAIYDLVIPENDSESSECALLLSSKRADLFNVQIPKEHLKPIE